MITRLARLGLFAILCGILIAIVGSIAVAVFDPAVRPPADDVECTDPPCFGGNGLPGAADLPVALSMVAYGLAVLSGVPAGLLALTFIARRTWRTAGRLLVPALGPLLVVIGMELVPHVVNVCFAADLLQLPLPGFCTRGEHGVDVADHLHLLQHTFFGAIPLATGYWLALRRSVRCLGETFRDGNLGGNVRT